MKRGSILLIIPVALAMMLLIGLLVTLPASAGTAMGPNTQNQDEPVTIRYWHHNTGDREEFVNRLIEEFRERLTPV